jgi:hypothetical protein
VTAGHVIKIENPVIAFGEKDRQVVSVSSFDLQETGLRSIRHPAGYHKKYLFNVKHVPSLFPRLKMI